MLHTAWEFSCSYTIYNILIKKLDHVEPLSNYKVSLGNHFIISILSFVVEFR